MIQTWPLDLNTVIASETEPSERTSTPQFAGVFLIDATSQGQTIEGRISDTLPNDVHGVKLRLQRQNIILPVQFINGTDFVSHLDFSLDEADMVRLEANDFLTPYRWIDQPSKLAQYGARTYHVRTKGKLETLLGAEKLFQELMNFLWERIEPDSLESSPQLSLQHRSVKRKDQAGEDQDDSSPPPGMEAFITEERLVLNLQLRVDQHHPYDRSLVSLQDLLSLVLLRLTTPTYHIQAQDRDDHKEEDDEKQQAEKERQQRNTLERLRAYLISYCNRYADRLTIPEFACKASPEVLFQNQYTLGRILLEFSSKAAPVFTPDDLFRCFWLIWAPFTWPEAIGRDHRPTSSSLIQEFKIERVQTAWHNAKMPHLVVVMFSEVLGQPPNWRAGLWMKDTVETFLAAREWLRRAMKDMGNDTFSGASHEFIDVFGIPSVSDLLSGVQIRESHLQYLQENFNKIASYLPPVEEKYALLIEFGRLIHSGTKDASKMELLIEQIHRQGLDAELSKYKANPKSIVAVSEYEETLYCPKCGAELTTVAESLILKGNLTLCSSGKDAWLYMRSEAPEMIL